MSFSLLDMPSFEANLDTTPQVLSPNRPPQLNESVCGCRCGCGCSGVLEDGEGRSERDGGSTFTRATTLFDPDDEPESSDGPEPHVTPDTFAVRNPLPWMDGGAREVPTRYGSFIFDSNGFRPSQRVIAVEDESLRPFFNMADPEVDGNNDSMLLGPASDARSAMLPNDRSIRPMSPGPGLGQWAEERVHCENHFLAKPLRLTPQRQFCRGLVASHLVVRDDGPRTGRAETFFHGSSAASSLFP